MERDVRGLEVGTESAEAAALMDEAVMHFLEQRTDTADLLARAIDADPGFVMPRVLRASGMLLMGTDAVRPAIDAELAAIEEIGVPALPRERLHVSALERWAAGDLLAAVRDWERIVVTWPHDLLAHRSLHMQSFWTGRARHMRQVVGGALPRWNESMPGYGFLLGMLAFGLEECGDYAGAERYGRLAVDLNSEDMWSIHAVAHVLEMQGRTAEGAVWLDYPADRWRDRGPFKGHLWWHAALFALERGEFDKVLALYDAHVRPGERFVSTDMMNAPSLLARLEFQGVDVGDRFERLAERSESWADDHVVVFTDTHTMIPLARTGRQQACDAFLASLENLASRPDSYAASVTRTFLLPLAEAVRAFYSGEPERTVEILMPIRAELQPIGGSFAQRDVFHQLLLEAAMAAEDWPTARQLASERTALRPDNGMGWRKLSAVLSGMGDETGAATARMRADQSLTVPISPNSLPV